MLRGLQETRVATREESGVLGFPSRRGLTPRGSLAGVGSLSLLQRIFPTQELNRGLLYAARDGAGTSCSGSGESDSAAPWTLAYQAPPSLGFSRQEHWSGLPPDSAGGKEPAC